MPFDGNRCDDPEDKGKRDLSLYYFVVCMAVSAAFWSVIVTLGYRVFRFLTNH